MITTTTTTINKKVENGLVKLDPMVERLAV
jgi:hypothetical protein